MKDARQRARGGSHGAFPRPGEVLIAPSLLSADFSRLAAELKKVERAGCRWIHLDVMDNHFVPNLTFGAPVIKALRPASRRLFFDAHLMVEEPGSFVEPMAAAGVQNLTFHIEAAGAASADLAREIKAAGMAAGVSIKPNTSVDAIEHLLPLLDLVLVMTVEPGFGGQEMLPTTLSKVQQLRRLRDTLRATFAVQVDGGISASTAGLAVAAGAEILVAGSSVFRGGEVAANVEQILAAVR